jgi:hypothetical protein
MRASKVIGFIGLNRDRLCHFLLHFRMQRHIRQVPFERHGNRGGSHWREASCEVGVHSPDNTDKGYDYARRECFHRWPPILDLP